MKKLFLLSICLGIVLMLFNACNKDFGAGKPVDFTNTVKATIDNNPRYSMFKALYQYCDSLTIASEPATLPTIGASYLLVGPTLETGFITAFIPTNDAFLNNRITYIENGGLINPALLKFVTRAYYTTTTPAVVITPATLPLATLRQFLGNHINNKMLAASDLQSYSGLKTLGGTGPDSLYLFQTTGATNIYAQAQIDFSAPTNTNNGNLYPINNPITPVFNGSFIQYLAADTTFTLFNQALVKANVAAITTAANTATNRSTILAPTNQAMIAAGYSAAVISASTTTAAALGTLVKHHIFSTRKIYSANFVAGPLTMLDGTTVTVNIGTKPTFTSLNTVGAANILTPDILCARVAIQKIDKVLIP